MTDTAESILKEVWDIQQEEDNYRFKNLSCYKGEVTDDVRNKWLDDLKVIAHKRFLIWEKVRAHVKAGG